MKRFRKIPLVAWAVFSAIFLPGAAGAGESVLCFGADGHVAVEAAAFPGACVSTSVAWDTSANAPERGLSRKADHCGPCADVPSLSGPWANTGVSSQDFGNAAWPAMSPLPASTESVEIPASAGQALLTLRPNTPTGSPPAFLRTTVLLI